MNTKQQVAEAKNLSALRDALNNFTPSNEHQRLEDVVDLCGLPTFGGADPVDTAEVWSWDAENVLLHDGNIYVIERRDPDAWYDRKTSAR